MTRLLRVWMASAFIAAKTSMADYITHVVSFTVMG